MTGRGGDGLSGWKDQRFLGRLSDPSVGELAPADLDRARKLRAALDHALRAADLRHAEEAAAARRPPSLSPYADWTWRPDLWRRPVVPSGQAATGPETRLSPDVRLFHDCPLVEMSARQAPAAGPEGAPFAVALDVYRFRGSYLSLAIDLPEEAARNLRLRHVIRLDTGIRTERPTALYARLNLEVGPKTVRIVRELPLRDHAPAAEFDLAAPRIDLAQVDRMWLDLIVDAPDMNGIVLSEMHLSRKPRAEV